MKFQYILCYGSSEITSIVATYTIEFQYILCYGSSIKFISEETLFPCFNTSYVTVHQAEQCKAEFPNLFQYILCYGSSLLHIMTILPNSRFNTSYVTVHHTYKVYKIGGVKSFNTSYVTVHLAIPSPFLPWYFVSIHPMLRFISNFPPQRVLMRHVSIHPMLRFIH